VADILDINADLPAAARVASYVIDADQHLNPPPTMWADYLPAAWRSRAPVVEHAEDGDYIVFEGERKKVNLLSAQAGRRGEQFKAVGRLTDARVGGWMAPARIADMDRDGIDVALLYGGGSLGTGDPQLFLASFSAYNHWVADFCSHDPKRLKGVAYIPMLDVGEAVRHMREAVAMGLTAVNIPGFPMTMESIANGGMRGVQTVALTGDPMGERQYRDPYFDPFWAAAVELDVAVTFHLGTRSTRFADKAAFLPDLLMSKLTMAEPVAIMIHGGVFDRFPTLRVGLIESGVSWFGFMASYMDSTWERQRYWLESSLKEKPSFYLDRNVYGSFIDDPLGVELRHEPGCKNIMWSSDYPHSETSFPNSHKSIERHFQGVPASERDWIVAGCAKAFFGIA
jgi:predicted TIM-barrel fold metal-dependent hydrolase